ncbi:MAG: hypothetical protein IB618_00940 [Candidatus Pacearchaeota archaeon]|nr:MAG: hypothetical protein IB618_00940 [Candidatus Pacearchaeota archaeon]
MTNLIEELRNFIQIGLDLNFNWKGVVIWNIKETLGRGIDVKVKDIHVFNPQTIGTRNDRDITAYIIGNAYIALPSDLTKNELWGILSEIPHEYKISFYDSTPKDSKKFAEGIVEGIYKNKKKEIR